MDCNENRDVNSHLVKMQPWRKPVLLMSVAHEVTLEGNYILSDNGETAS